MLKLKLIIFTESDKLLNLISRNEDLHFFLDETPVRISGISTEILARISRTLNPDSYLWIACLGDMAPNDSDRNLSGNMSFGQYNPR
jgi:hypothetical protein